MFKKITWLLLLGFTFAFSAKREAGDDCKENLKRIFARLSLIKSPPADKIYLLEYRIRTVFKDQGIPESNLKVKMIAGSRQRQLVSDQMEIYEDQQDVFAVIPSRKIICRRDSQIGKQDTLGTDQFIKLQQAVLEQSAIRLCKSVQSSDGKYDQETVIEPSVEVRDKFAVSKVRFLVNTRTGSIYRTEMSFTEKSKYRQVELTYLNMDFDYKKARLDHHVWAKFLSADGSLLSAFAGYKLIDIRKNK